MYAYSSICCVNSQLPFSSPRTTNYLPRHYFYTKNTSRTTRFCLLPRKKLSQNQSKTLIQYHKSITNSLTNFAKKQLPYVFSFVVFSLALGFKLHAHALSFRRSLPQFACISSSSSQVSDGSKSEKVTEVIEEIPAGEIAQGENFTTEEKCEKLDTLKYEKVSEIEDDKGLGVVSEISQIPSSSSSVNHETAVADFETGSSEELEFEDENLKKKFEVWKSKPCKCSVPLRIVALLESMPPAWMKEFVQVQGRMSKINVEYRRSLEEIISDLVSCFEKRKLTPRSAMSADLVTVGDSWLELSIRAQLIDPIQNIEHHDWFKQLHNKWKAHLTRDRGGHIVEVGEVWGVPYRWGCMVVAYRKDIFLKNKIPLIEDWKDLWRAELQNKIAMVDDPREVIGAVLKSLGASYNARDFDLDVPGGKDAVRESLHHLQKQVLLFDRENYLKAFEAGDVWVAVGWSNNIVPAAKRMSKAAVIVPKSGTSLWADLWCIPATRHIPTDKVGGRVRGPSPLVTQWFEFCLQTSRAVPFLQGVFPGSSPLFLEEGIDDQQLNMKREKGPKFDTNLVYSMPPPDVLPKCEFLEPLSIETLEQYEWVMTRPLDTKVNLFHGIQKWFHGSIQASKDVLVKD